ncbi:MAG: hypothetical protein NVV62_06870 [Terricaulis sp.]|nr:hypothetical protein [Terricaulis sp.]
MLDEMSHRHHTPRPSHAIGARDLRKRPSQDEKRMRIHPIERQRARGAGRSHAFSRRRNGLIPFRVFEFSEPLPSFAPEGFLFARLSKAFAMGEKESFAG